MTDRGYARISLDTAASGSIAKQKAAITKHADNTLTLYTDESVSGSKVKFADRPAGKELLADLQPGDRILATKIDRVARNVRDLLDLVEHVEQRGASIVFVEQSIDTSGPVGKFLLTLLGAIAELEAGIVAERRREAVIAFHKEGRLPSGSLPYGYQKQPHPNGRGWVARLDPDTSPLLREALEDVLAGASQRDVADRLQLPYTTFGHLLRNPRLAGLTAHNGTIVTIDGVPKIDPDAAILSLTEWRQLQELLQPTRKAWTKREGYGAALSCAVCKQRLYIQGTPEQTRTYAYKCLLHNHKPGEKGVTVSASRAHQHLEETFLNQFGHLQVVTGQWSDSHDHRLEAIAHAQTTLDVAQQAFLASSSDAMEEDAMRQLKAAKQALRDAESLPSQRTYTATPTGQTVKHYWQQADDTQRTNLLTKAGTWEVQPGHHPNPHNKIKHTPDTLTQELQTHPIGDNPNTQGFYI